MVIQVKLLQHDLEAAKRKEIKYQRLSELQAKKEASLRQTKAVEHWAKKWIYICLQSEQM